MSLGGADTERTHRPVRLARREEGEEVTEEEEALPKQQERPGGGGARGGSEEPAARRRRIRAGRLGGPAEGRYHHDDVRPHHGGLAGSAPPQALPGGERQAHVEGE